MVELGGAAAEELDAVLDGADDARLDELLGGDGLGGVEAAVVDPLFYLVEVGGGELEGAPAVR